jgi:hypothetical protein
MTPTEREQFKTNLLKEVAQRHAARLQETRDNMHWRNAGQHHWRADTAAGQVYCVRQAEHKWFCGFVGGKELPAVSLAEAKEMLVEYLAEHDTPPRGKPK